MNKILFVPTVRSAIMHVCVFKKLCAHKCACDGCVCVEWSAELIKKLLIALPGVSVTDSTVWKHTAAHTARLAPPLSQTHTRAHAHEHIHNLAFLRRGGGGGRERRNRTELGQRLKSWWVDMDLERGAWLSRWKGSWLWVVFCAQTDKKCMSAPLNYSEEQPVLHRF